MRGEPDEIPPTGDPTDTPDQPETPLDAPDVEEALREARIRFAMKMFREGQPERAWPLLEPGEEFAE
jgi:hypothetical protein